MLTRLELQNFRGFKTLALDLKHVSVVVGPNSSGKTTVLHAIGLALRAYSIVLDDPETHPVTKGATVWVCDGLIVRDHTRLLPIAERNELFRNGEVSEGVKSTVTLSFDSGSIRKLEVTLSFMRNAVLKLAVTVESPDAVEAVEAIRPKSKNRPIKLLEFLRRDRPTAVLVPAFYGVTLNEEYRAGPVVDELLQSGQQSSIVRNLVARLQGPDLEQLNAFLQRTIGARLDFRTTSLDAERVNPLIVQFSDSNGSLDLSAAGAGLVNLIALFASLKFRQSSGQGTTIFLFDEPEAHLHPRLQGIIGDELANAVRAFPEAQVLFATHSVEMINRLGRRDDAVLFSVERSAMVAARLDSEVELVDELSRWADLSPFASLNFLSSRRILFHEGPSDAEILVRCAEALFLNKPVLMSDVRRWTLVALDGSGNTPAMKALEKVIQPKLFPGLAQGAPVRIVLVLDRDRSRAPGMTPSKSAPIQGHELVWSRNSIESLFLEPALLAGWIFATFPSGGTPLATIQKLVADGIAVADKDQVLLDSAAKDRMVELLKQSVKPAQAMQQALDEVRAAPATWQKGRDRARRILEHVRKGLAHGEAKLVRGTVADQIADARLTRLPNPESAVPPELRALLEQMTA